MISRFALKATDEFMNGVAFQRLVFGVRAVMFCATRTIEMNLI